MPGDASSDTQHSTLLYDGDCSFCRAWVDHWKQFTGDAVACVAMQAAPAEFQRLLEEEDRAAVLLVERDGGIRHGADAVFTTLQIVPSYCWLRWSYEHLPGFAAASEVAYGIVARHRDTALWITRLLWGVPIRRVQHAVTSQLFVRLLGLIYLIAFVSFGVQAAGLIGHDGVAPIAEALPAVRQYYGARAYWVFPTVFWLGASDAAICAVWLLGVAASTLMLLRRFARASGLVALILYLSLSTAGQAFLSFQWDALLLESGLVALLIRSSGAGAWLGRWLLFRLMFMSGAVKLLSGDATWRNLTALEYHFETQPLPTVFGWYAHHLPAAVLRALTLGSLTIELLVPFLIFFPRRARFAACVALVALQASIFITGNYAFFNLLTVALCLFLLDDVRLAGWMKRSAKLREDRARTERSRGLGIARSAAICVIILASLGEAAMRLFNAEPPLASQAARLLAPFRVVNSYGLFAVMTTTRPEIVLEGSIDGAEWREYRFRWKPGALNAAPRWVQPHQPRLDWQMWFAALSNYQNEPWIVRLVQRMLQGSPATLALLDGNPFPQAPPRYVRAVLYQYHFTTLVERRQSGNWWRRERLGLYLPALSLEALMRAGVR